MSKMSMHALVLQEQEGEALCDKLEQEVERSARLREALHNITVYTSAASHVVKILHMKFMAKKAIEEN